MNDSTIRPSELRARLPRTEWLALQPFGPAGFMIRHRTEPMHIIVTEGPTGENGMEIRHASIGHRDRMPTYDEMAIMHRACFSGWAYQVFAPDESHVNIYEFALHLWGRPDGAPLMPNFGRNGTI
jgi:hypothetical protein